MSEYQYYEFQALDRALTPEEQRAVARLSSRVAPHPRSAVFTYNYSDFPGDPLKILTQYYDVMFYIANWGSRRLAFRFPVALMDVDAMRQYTVSTLEHPSRIISVSTVDDYVILDLSFHEEEGLGWVDGAGWLAPLIGLRDALMQRDYRVLYLAWLKAITLEYDADERAMEPPVPPGLGKLTAALDSFVERFDVPRNLLGIAAERSPALESTRPDEAEVRQRIASLPADEKEDILLRLFHDEPQLSFTLRKHLGLLEGEQVAEIGPRRTIGELRSAWGESQ